MLSLLIAKWRYENAGRHLRQRIVSKRILVGTEYKCKSYFLVSPKREVI